METAFTVS